MNYNNFASRALVALALVAAASSMARAQFGYGVNAAGNLFRFTLAAPASVTTLGPVGFVPEGIDFRPGSQALYAIDIGATTTSLYTLSLTNGAPTLVGSFNSTGTVNAVNYNLTGNQTFGFDFNPKTLQADNSMRIRLVSTNGVNMRLNSSTGQVAAVDVNLAFGSGNAPFIDGSAYINNVPATSGVTALYDMDSRNDALLIQDPPNNGTVATVGAFGVSIDAQNNIGFDILTADGSVDDTIGGDSGYAVFRRTDVSSGAYLLYSVNLATGATTNGALVGGGLGFEGGFSVAAGIPEPSTLGLMLAGCAALVRRRRLA